MNKFMSWKKTLTLILLLVTPLILVRCGSGGETVASHTVGPVGPSWPSSYYFDATVTPHTIKNNGTVLVTVQIWDSNGNVAGGVLVTIVGPETSGTATSDSGGLASAVLTVTGNAGSIVYLTCGVEDTVLTIPVQVLANGGA